MNIRPLTAADLPSLLACFNESFSDYLIPFVLTEPKLRQLLARRGVRLDLSVGAFEGEAMVGFTINGLHERTAYDSGTGVVPAARKRGVAKQLMQRSIDLLRDHADSYVLEVLEANVKAEALYRSLGFTETRRLQCWSYSAPQRTHARELANVNLRTIRDWCDVAPSWQNETHSVGRAREPYVALGDERGAAIVFPISGDLPLLAVAHDARRNGLGRRLLAAAATRAAKPLRMINVDDGDAGLAAFLASAGAQRTVRQIEMILPLR